MKKVQITAEQEKALKEWMAEGLNFESFMKSRYRGKWIIDELKPLNTITPEQFSLMLNGWYEVIDDIQVGDWVEYKGYKFYKVVNYKHADEEEKRIISVKYVNGPSETYKKVTEPWKIMLLELGREKPEFKDGDKYTDNLGISYTEKKLKRKAETHFKNGKVKYFYPVESRIEVKNQLNHILKRLSKK